MAKSTKQSLSQLTDQELVTLSRQGNDKAFEALFKRYSPRMASFARYLCKNDDHAEETSHEAFIKAFQGLDSFKGESSFSTWLHQIAKNLCWSRKRKIKNHPVDSLESAAFGEESTRTLEVVDWSSKADDILLKKELNQIMDQAIRQLPEEYRVVLVLRDIEENSNEETAQILGLSVAAVKSRLHRARLFVRQKIDRYLRET